MFSPRQFSIYGEDGMWFEEKRRAAREVCAGSLTIGGNAPISVQSMLNTDSHDAEACIAQAKRLCCAGCDIVRMAVPDREAAATIASMKEAGVRAPLVADIHFDYRIALEAVACGADKIRINPGNIGSDERVRAVVSACRERGLPIRIGVNAGSLQKDILAKYGGPTPKALAESAMAHVRLLERFDFTDIVVSVKASQVCDMIMANRLLSEMCPYPLHLGVTEAGTIRAGTLKSAAGIGSLLCDGIGDTIRVSLTADPEEEVRAAHGLLQALGIGRAGSIDLVSCPTCGRTKIPLISMAEELERRLAAEVHDGRKLRVALMGCAVNGPGEAREADIGAAGGDGEAVLFKKGVVVRRIAAAQLVDELIREINEMRDAED